MTLPNGQELRIPSADGTDSPLLSPVADLSPVAAAGRATGEVYRQILKYPGQQGKAITFLVSSLGSHLGQGGVFDYQRKGTRLTGYTQFPDYVHVSNYNVGLFRQQAGLSIEDTLDTAGRVAGFISKNADPSTRYGLNSQQERYIRQGYADGAQGLFGAADGR